MSRLRTLIIVLLSLFILLNALMLQANASYSPQEESLTLLEQRQIFQPLYTRLLRGELPAIEQALTKLTAYPLKPYLEYQLLRNQLAYQRVDEAALLDFLQRHSHSLMAQDLHTAWLDQLFQQQAWPEFLRDHFLERTQPTPARQCQLIYAHWQLDRLSLWQLTQAYRLWHTHQPLANACQYLTDLLQQQDLLSDADLVQASYQLLLSNRASMAQQMAAQGSDSARRLVAFWQQMQRQPDHQLHTLLATRPDFWDEHLQHNKDLLTQLLIRRMAQQPETTLHLAQQLYQQDYLDTLALIQVQEQQALRLAWRSDPQAITLFAQLPASALSEEGWRWFARSLLRHERWDELTQLIPIMPSALQVHNEWRYWLAAAWQRLGHLEHALPLYADLARERHYYGFMAAQHLGLAPRMNDLTPLPDPQQWVTLAAHPAILRSAELFALGYREQGRREWFFALTSLTPDERLQAAWLAQSWGWYELSARTANQANNDAIRLRFPLGHLETLAPLAASYQIDLALILALIRKESIFTSDARSSAGALGLMQVMPATGRQVARQLRLELNSSRDLLNPQFNLPIGVFYLSQLLERFQQPAVTAAAYNAGPQRTQRWMNEFGAQADPLWVERITYGETRDYVKSLLAFQEVYRWLLLEQQAPTIAIRE